MSSRRNGGHELNDVEIEALVRLRVLRVPDRELLRRLPHEPPSRILATVTQTADSRIDQRVVGAMSELRALDVGVVTVADARFPASLRKLGDLTPPILFYRGDFDLAHQPAVAIVGTRRSTEYGNDTAEMLAAELARYGVATISGLALGVDTHAHVGAVEAGGRTVAVLGCGINVTYPHRNQRLQERIAREGLLLSEFAPGEPAMPHHFLQRNRIIALLGAAVIVVEAGVKSGSLKTAMWAIDHGVDVFAVPGPIGRDASQGTNALLLDGAHMVTSIRDVIDHLPWRLSATERARADRDEPTGELASRIYRALGPISMQIDELARAAGCASAEALNCLVELELAGHVRQLPGKRFTRAGPRTG